jgi:hypothetical protein
MEEQNQYALIDAERDRKAEEDFKNLPKIRDVPKMPVNRPGK